MIQNPSIEVSGIIIDDDETLFFNWCHLENHDCGSSSTNPILGALTTSHACIELNKYRNTVVERAIYLDTDFCAYSAGSESEKLRIGPYSAVLTDELDGGFMT